MLEQRISTPAQQKWLVKLMGFDFCVEYKKGNTNVAANALSRMGETGELIAISIIDPIWIQE